MPDIASISALITSVKAATDIAKLIKNSAVSLEEAETKLQLAELISTLADVKIELAEVQDGLRDKDQNILALKEKLDKKESTTFDGTVYWVKGDDVPFCTVCYEKESKYHHLTYSTDVYNIKQRSCKICKCSYKT